MKIGIDARMYSDSFTGIGRYTYELIERCVLDTDHEWVVFMNNPEFEAATFPSHVTKVLVDARHYSYREQTYFLKILNKEKCDLVHFTHFNVPLLYNKNFVVTIHDTTISYFPGKKMNTFFHKLIYNLIMRHAIFGSKKIITVSNNTKKDLGKLFKVNPRKITVIHNGLGDDFYEVSKKEQSDVRKKYDLKKTFFLYTGVWREHKNIVGMLHAFAHIVKNTEYKDLQLVLTGKPDPYYPEVLETIQKLNISAYVKTVGLIPFDDLRALYNAAKAYVFPSFYEGFGLPPLEAMKVGTPTLVSNTSAIPEVCQDAALYFDPYDPSDIALQMRRILQDQTIEKDLIKKGRVRVNCFSWERCAKETQEVYKEVL